MCALAIGSAMDCFAGCIARIDDDDDDVIYAAHICYFCRLGSACRKKLCIKCHIDISIYWIFYFFFFFFLHVNIISLAAGRCDCRTPVVVPNGPFCPFVRVCVHVRALARMCEFGRSLES